MYSTMTILQYGVLVRQKDMAKVSCLGTRESNIELRAYHADAGRREFCHNVKATSCMSAVPDDAFATGSNQHSYPFYILGYAYTGIR